MCEDKETQETTYAVCTDGENRIEFATIPIIVLPGLMASRLQFKGKNRTWDPDSEFWSMAYYWVSQQAARYRRKLHYQQKVTVMTDGDFRPNQLKRGWGGLAKNYYGEMLKFLESLDYGSFQTPVYAVGYDWRQCNNDSAVYVEGKIQKILENEDAEKFILITHSMGGLVGRALLQRQSDLCLRALAVIHIGQPAFGAAVMYRRMFTGAPTDWDEYKMRALLGDEAWEVQTIVSGIKSPLQLLPTDRLRGRTKRSWLRYHTFENPDESHSWDGKVSKLYLRKSSPPGIIAEDWKQPHWIDKDYQRELRDSIGNANKFHEVLGDWHHENTWTITTNDLQTNHTIEFTLPPNNPVIKIGGSRSRPITRVYGIRSDGREIYWTNKPHWEKHIKIKKPDPLDTGDGTVPTQSSTGLLGTSAYPLEMLSEENADHYRQILISGAEHSAMCNDPQVLTALRDIITHIVGKYP